jgi:ectoine hydroxylase-related dioxygenase (phytanoyl-CoA dioxygenase family)
MFSVTQPEREAGKLSADKLALILSEINTNGFALVTDLVSADTCGLLFESVLEDVEQVRSEHKPTRHENATGRGHLQLGLRRYAPYVREDLVANPLIENIVAAVLGPDAWLGFYNGNVNLPGSVHQPVHYDRPYSWRSRAQAEEDGQSWPPPPTTLSCSVALTEITQANGATEIYPGSHRETDVAQLPIGERISEHPDLLERWSPPARMPIPCGAVCFRDPRMWHRGVPNPGDQVRPMIALTYHSGRCLSWRGRLVRDIDSSDVERCKRDPSLKLLDDGGLADGRLVFEESTREVFESADSPHQVNRNVRFVSSPHRVNHFLDAHQLGGARIVENGPLVAVE